MISLDSNLLLYAFALSLPEHARAREFLESLAAREDVAISEFVLVEFYRLLRLPALHAHPLSANQAAQAIQTYRRHHGITDFATANVKDFQGFGFARVWNPLAEPS